MSEKYFEYFDELTKTQVVNTLNSDAELREKVFERLYDGDFASFAQIRKLPAIAADRRARDLFITGDGQKAVSDAIQWITIAGIAKKAMANDDRIIGFKTFLESMSAQEIAALDPLAVARPSGDCRDGLQHGQGDPHEMNVSLQIDLDRQQEHFLCRTRTSQERVHAMELFRKAVPGSTFRVEAGALVVEPRTVMALRANSGMGQVVWSEDAARFADTLARNYASAAQARRRIVSCN